MAARNGPYPASNVDPDAAGHERDTPLGSWFIAPRIRIRLYGTQTETAMKLAKTMHPDDILNRLSDRQIRLVLLTAALALLPAALLQEASSPTVSGASEIALWILGGSAYSIGFTLVVYQPDRGRQVINFVTGICFLTLLGGMPDFVAQQPFYEATAQLIPILILALALETRQFHDAYRTPAERMMFLQPLSYLSLAGVITLSTLAGIDRSPSARTVAAALAAGTLAIVMLAVVGPRQTASIRDADPPNCSQRRVDGDDDD
jgi:hypothetical protein